MSLIINIDTATETAQISIAREGVLLDAVMNTMQKDHGAFIQPAIQQLLAKYSIDFSQIDAVAATIGPGSYTGIRVGMASAKGICYALNKPFIAINTLELLAASALEQKPEQAAGKLLCPLIDARRMEVFTALFDTSLAAVLSPAAMILDPDSFAETLQQQPILFFGSGSKKWKAIATDAAAFFEEVSMDAAAMSRLSYRNFVAGQFASLAHSDPFYLKEFYDTKSK